MSNLPIGKAAHEFLEFCPFGCLEDPMFPQDLLIERERGIVCCCYSVLKLVVGQCWERRQGRWPAVSKMSASSLRVPLHAEQDNGWECSTVSTKITKPSLTSLILTSSRLILPSREISASFPRRLSTFSLK